MPRHGGCSNGEAQVISIGEARAIRKREARAIRKGEAQVISKGEAQVIRGQMMCSRGVQGGQHSTFAPEGAAPKVYADARGQLNPPVGSAGFQEGCGHPPSSILMQPVAVHHPGCTHLRVFNDVCYCNWNPVDPRGHSPPPGPTPRPPGTGRGCRCPAAPAL